MYKNETIEIIKNIPQQTEETLNDAFALLVDLEDRKSADHYVRWIRHEAKKIPTVSMYELVEKTYLYAGQYDFDSFMVGMEFRREPSARFWLPRRKVLEGKHHIASKIQEFIDDPNGKCLAFSQSPGTGKLLSDDTPVLTRNGWKNHGDLVVGDEVIGVDGKFKKVTHVFPKHYANRRVWFTDGSYIDCHENHEWLIYARSCRKLKVYETKQLESFQLETGTPGKRRHRYQYQLPLRPVIAGEHKELPVKPYTFGVWLGDGITKGARICSSCDDNVVISGVLEDGYKISSMQVHATTGVEYYQIDGLNEDLRKIELGHSRIKQEKYIPECYLTASITQRLELLAGLMDTDSHYDRSKGGYNYSTTNVKLRDGIIALLHTFGWRVEVRREEAKLSTSGVQGRKDVWILAFNPTVQIPCRVKRKQMKQTMRQLKLAVAKIEPIEPKQGNCIEVDGGIYLVGKNMHPTHNSTLIKFLLAYTIGRDPNGMSMYVSYSNGMVKLMLDSIKSFLTDDFEYNFNRIFPNLGTPDISAEYQTVSYRRKGDFPSLSLVALGGSVTGRTRANRLLVVDDLVTNKEMARSPERLEKLYDDFQSTLTTRMIGNDSRVIMLGTRWSIHDPIGRMEEKYRNTPGYTFIAIPVWDENKHSNFEYECNDNYTDEKIREIEERLDPVDFSCLYMQRGIDKEGLAFPSDQLKYYNGTLPDGEPDNVTFYCDVAFGGGDSLSMPIAYIYGSDCYIHDVVFDKGTKDITEPRVVSKILQHKCKMGRFEGNNGGDLYKDDIDRLLREKGYHCNLTSKKAPTNMSKVARIEQYQPEIKNYYFLDRQNRSQEYQKFMDELCTFSFTTKNLHDDAPDSMAGLAAYMFNGVKYVQVVKRPF